MARHLYRLGGWAYDRRRLVLVAWLVALGLVFGAAAAFSGKTTNEFSVPGTGDAGVAALTERELQVARMIIDRRTNAEIAAALFLSPKTVESHIRNLFHKLSVSSRVEVARAVERATQ